MIRALAALAVLLTAVAISEAADCKAKSIPADKFIASKAFLHQDVANIGECIQLCAKHVFCLSAGFNPKAADGKAKCLLSYRGYACDGVKGDDVSATGTSSQSGEVVLTCLTGCENANNITDVSTTIPSKPNFLILLADDFGYGDLQSFGNANQERGFIDDLASRGIKFLNWFAGDALCSPSRVSIQTARIPARAGMYGGKSRVFLPQDVLGMPETEVTIAEQLRTLGYTTGMAGKWHMGINSKTRTDGTWLPMNNGYDYVGYFLPFSNDWVCDSHGTYMPEGPELQECYLYNNSQIVEQPINLDKVLKKLLSSFNEFIDTYGQDPWYFYFGFPHTHSALFHDVEFANSSRRGLYGNCLNEMHWGAGEIIAKVERAKIADKTLVVFTSDHGPHIEVCTSGGWAGGLKGGKANSWEGGFRVPAFAYWPGVIRPNQVSHALMTSMDIYPSFVKLAGGTMQTNLTFDGLDTSQELLGRADGDPNRPIYYFCMDKIFAIRYKGYKFHFSTQQLVNDTDNEKNCPGGWPLRTWFKGNTQCNDPGIVKHDPPLIFYMNNDPYENHPITKEQDKNLAPIYDTAIKLAKDKEDDVNKNKQKQVITFLNYDVTPCCSGNENNCICGWPEPLPKHWNITQMSKDMGNKTHELKYSEIDANWKNQDH